MKTGIVMQIESSNTLIMGQNGEFVWIKTKNGWRIGDIVAYDPRSYRKTSLYILAACITIFLMAGVLTGYLYFKQVTLLSIDVNPSIEIGVNRFDQVIYVNAHNEEGEEILETLHLKYRNYEDAISLLLGNEEINTYISLNSYIYFTVQSNSWEKEQAYLRQIASYKESILSHHKGAEVEYCSVDASFAEEAHQYGVTAGKYKILLELKLLDSSVDLNQYSHHSIGELMEIINESCDENQEHNHGGYHGSHGHN